MISVYLCRILRTFKLPKITISLQLKWMYLLLCIHRAIEYLHFCLLGEPCLDDVALYKMSCYTQLEWIFETAIALSISQLHPTYWMRRIQLLVSERITIWQHTDPEYFLAANSFLHLVKHHIHLFEKDEMFSQNRYPLAQESYDKVYTPEVFFSLRSIATLKRWCVYIH